MDLIIPMGQKTTPRTLWRWPKGVENYTPKLKKLLEHVQKRYEKHANKT